MVWLLVYIRGFRGICFLKLEERSQSLVEHKPMNREFKDSIYTPRGEDWTQDKREIDFTLDFLNKTVPHRFFKGKP